MARRRAQKSARAAFRTAADNGARDADSSRLEEPTAENLIEQIIEKRIREIQDAFNSAYLEQFKQRLVSRGPRLDPQSDKSDQALREAICSGVPGPLQLPPRPANVLDLDVMVKVRDEIIPILVRALPPVSKQDVLTMIRQAWPSASATGQQMFDASLVRRAHAAFLRENPPLKADAATHALASRLSISTRTIETLLRQARARRKD